MIDLPFTQHKPKSKPQRWPKSEALKELEEQFHEYKKVLHPDVPYLVRTKFNDQTANGLTKCIAAWCKVNGAHFQRQNSQGQYDPRLKIWRKSGSTKGISDCLVIYKGNTINIEIKAGKDKQSDVQKEIQSSIESAGGIYWIIQTYTGFIDNIQKL
jgi:hypothetical protein